jgi:hypothetical protein
MAENSGKELYLYLKDKTLHDTNVYVEVNMKSKTFIETEECELKYCKITGKFDEEIFQLVNSVYAEPVKFSEVEKWERDNEQPDKKINLYLKRDVVFPKSVTL